MTGGKPIGEVKKSDKLIVELSGKCYSYSCPIPIYTFNFVCITIRLLISHLRGESFPEKTNPILGPILLTCSTGVGQGFFRRWGPQFYLMYQMLFEQPSGAKSIRSRPILSSFSMSKIPQIEI